MLKFGTGCAVSDSEVSNFMKIEMTVPTVVRTNFPLSYRTGRPSATARVTALDGSRSLEMSLAATAEVRAEAVARGRALVADPNWPSKAQMRQLAGVLAARWSR